MTDNAWREIHEACLALERYRIATYADAEVSKITSDGGTVFIKPRGECDIREVRLGSTDFESACLHSELYTRFTGTQSILLVCSEWISVASGAGWELNRASYGYVPSFSDTVPCTAKIRVPKDCADYPTALSDALDAVSKSEKLPRAALVRSHGAVILAISPMEAVEYAVTLEYAAKKAFYIRKFR